MYIGANKNYTFYLFWNCISIKNIIIFNWNFCSW